MTCTMARIILNVTSGIAGQFHCLVYFSRRRIHVRQIRMGELGRRGITGYDQGDSRARYLDYQCHGLAMG